MEFFSYDSLELTKAESNHSTHEEVLKTLDVSCSSFRFPGKLRATARKGTKLYLRGCLASSLKVKQVTVWFFNRGLRKTASLQPIGTSLNETENTVMFVNL